MVKEGEVEEYGGKGNYKCYNGVFQVTAMITTRTHGSSCHWFGAERDRLFILFSDVPTVKNTKIISMNYHSARRVRGVKMMIRAY